MSANNSQRAPASGPGSARTLFDKIWDAHLVEELGNGESLLYIDRVFLHERTGSIALESLAESGYAVRNPGQVFCTMDHIVDTFPGRGDTTTMPSGQDFILATRNAAHRAGVTLFDVNDASQGIVHVISPELGIVQPGVTLVCPDSHTCTQGAFGALAWGIGSTDAEHAMATQTLRLNRPKSLRVNFRGHLAPGVTAKDMILYLIAHYGAKGGSGYAVEFAGEAVASLGMEARMTLCNMAVEFAAFTGLIAVDDVTLAHYRASRPYAPSGSAHDAAVIQWRELYSDPDASFDREITIDASAIMPMVTWGTSPEHAVGVGDVVPDPSSKADANTRGSMEKALDYQDLAPGQSLLGLPIDNAFIGSCTNARLSDLREAAALLAGRQVAPGVQAICVPGSQEVKRRAEAEGLHLVFEKAGFSWREPGCSMCFFAGGEHFPAQSRVISTTNRNFEGRQGPGVKTLLASPITVAASAVAGAVADPRALLASDDTSPAVQQG